MSHKILIIDDEEAIVEALALRLGHDGYSVITAIDAFEGLKAAQEQRPDLVLLDIRMPGIDGLEINRRLKADPALAGIPVVFLSAHAQETIRHKAMMDGGKCFVSKPYDHKALLAVIETALGGTGCEDANASRSPEKKHTRGDANIRGHAA